MASNVGKTPLEINSVLLSFSYGVAGQCYDEIQIQRYVNLGELTDAQKELKYSE